jgi:hypothetical protein
MNSSREELLDLHLIRVEGVDYEPRLTAAYENGYNNVPLR